MYTSFIVNDVNTKRINYSKSISSKSTWASSIIKIEVQNSLSRLVLLMSIDMLRNLVRQNGD